MGGHIFPKPCLHLQSPMLWSQAVWILWWRHIVINSYWPCSLTTLPKSIMSDSKASGDLESPAAIRASGTQGQPTTPQVQRTYPEPKATPKPCYLLPSKCVSGLPAAHEALYQVLEMSGQTPTSEVLPGERGLHTRGQCCLHRTYSGGSSTFRLWAQKPRV